MPEKRKQSVVIIVNFISFNAFALFGTQLDEGMNRGEDNDN